MLVDGSIVVNDPTITDPSSCNFNAAAIYFCSQRNLSRDEDMDPLPTCNKGYIKSFSS